VDIDPVTFNIDPTKIEAAITRRTRAIMPIHLFGMTADMDPILKIAQAHDLAIIEDACQAHGAEYNGQRAGSFGTGCFSFYPTKNMTTAEGGMITTNDERVAEACRVARQHGMRRRYYHDELGYNFRMTDVHAAIGLAQLAKLEGFNKARIDNARYLSQHLEGVVTPTVPEGYRHVFHQYTVRVPDGRRDGLREALAERGIGTGVYYPVPVHKQHVYVERGYEDVHPEAERAAEEVLSLPVHPALSEEDLQAIVAAVNGLEGSE
jgi:dTDP-4-amino-4,6-dideoxygalactose transaminase